MVDPNELKALFEDIEAEPGELQAYRSRLAENLGEGRAKRPWIPFLLPLLAFCLLAALYLGRPNESQPQLSWSNRGPAEVVNLAESDPQTFREAAQKVLRKDHKSEAYYNAITVLAATSSDEEAVQYAARGLLEDPRPEYRYYYLEYILENADEYRWNREKVEALMDQENDPEVIQLYHDLLDLT